MGYNTTVVVMNDSLSSIKEDPEFGARLVRAILEVQRGKPVDVAAHGKRMLCCNAATVIETHHADHAVFVKVGQNYGEVVTVVDRCRAKGPRTYHAKLAPPLPLLKEAE